MKYIWSLAKSLEKENFCAIQRSDKKTDLILSVYLHNSLLIQKKKNFREKNNRSQFPPVNYFLHTLSYLCAIILSLGSA